MLRFNFAMRQQFTCAENTVKSKLKLSKKMEEKTKKKQGE